MFASLLASDIPRSVPVIFGVLAFLSLGGLRYLARGYFRGTLKLQKQPVIIYGAGEAGLQLQNALLHNYEYSPMAFIDDDPSLQKLTVGGLRVYSSGDLPKLIRKTGVKVIMLAIARLGQMQKRKIVNELEALEMDVKLIPSMSEIISGKAKISDLRSISAEQLLGRDPIAPVEELLNKNISKRAIMVTGAGGSIGSELCRQIIRQEPSIIVLYEMSEFALYEIESELSSTATFLQSHVRIVPIIGSILNEKKLESVIKAFKVQTIYHAAAYKHVPLVEENVIEGIMNNVFGTLSVSIAARKLDVENFILISTDKAVRPTNIMGATKRISELICQAYSTDSCTTIFSMVRFGNVLGSSGSVIPRFKAQIKAGGPVTVTHQNINRYFMTTREAAQLVIQAGALSRQGCVFVLDMGCPVKFIDLAFSMIKLHCLIPYMVDQPDQAYPKKGDIPVCVTGLRKGEKLYEELIIGKNPKKTKHPRILMASENYLSYEKLMPILDRLRQACSDFDLPGIRKILHELPLDYAPSSKQISDFLWEELASTEIGHRTTINSNNHT